jgi:hypothetical protein
MVVHSDSLEGIIADLGNGYRLTSPGLRGTANAGEWNETQADTQ